MQILVLEEEFENFKREYVLYPVKEITDTEYLIYLRKNSKFGIAYSSKYSLGIKKDEVIAEIQNNTTIQKLRFTNPEYFL